MTLQERPETRAAGDRRARGLGAHAMPVEALRAAWQSLPPLEQARTAGRLPAEVMVPLGRLVDPHGLHGYADAVVLAAAFARLHPEEVHELAGRVPFRLFWALARLSQNLARDDGPRAP